MKNISLILSITVILLLGYLLLSGSCNRCPDCPEIEIIKDTIPGDSIPYEIKVDKPVLVYRDTGSTQWRNMPIDTMAILQDYYARYFYADSITDDTSFLAIIHDSVSQNRITSRKFFMQNLKPTLINTTVNIKEKEPDPKGILFAGFDISGNTEKFSSFGPELIFKNKQDRLFRLGYNLLDEKANIQAGYYLPIRFRARR